MKIFQNVRSTAKNIPSIEVNVDTVYVRSEIKRVEEMEFSGWEYNEVQYKKDNYIELISDKNELLESSLLELTMNQAMKEMETENLILELTMLIGGM